MKQFWGIKNNFDGIWSETIRLAKVPGKTFGKTIILVFLITLSSDFLKAQDLKVMSFNVLYATATPKNWDTGRRELVVKTILHENPDIVGLQEVMDMQRVQLEGDLAQVYTLVTPWNNSYFGNSIGFRKTRFEEIRSGRITYSPTPDIPGTDFHNNDNSRYASWIVLFDKLSKDSIFVLSTHFYSPREQKEERYKSALILMDKLQILAKGKPIIAAGDYNMFETSDAYSAITTHKTAPLTDTYRFLHPLNPDIDGTVHGNTTDYPAFEGDLRLDYIFSSGLNIVGSGIIRTHFNQVYPSDHFPIYTQFSYIADPISK